MRHIRYSESCFRINLLRHPRARSKQTKVHVYPQIIIDTTSKVSLNQNQLNYLSYNGKLSLTVYNSFSINNLLFHSGPNYIRPNQTYLHSKQRREKRVKRQHDKIMNIVASHLIRKYHIPNISGIIKQFSQPLQTCLHQQYMTPISYLDAYRTRRELNLVKSIRHRLKKEELILRVTDKSGIFHIGHVKDYEYKAEAYRQKTGAYMELETNPLSVVYDKVVHLLCDLRSKNHIKAWQLNKMLPKYEEVELAYLYFVPKPHKVKYKCTSIALSVVFMFSLWYSFRKERH